MEQIMNVVPYVLVGLVIAEAALLLYKYNRAEFNRLALSAFLFAEQELGSESGQEKMAFAIQKIIESLPVFLRKSLEIAASLKKTDLHGLTHELAQKVYEAFKLLHP